MERPIFGGAYVRREICVSNSIGLACSGKEIYRFCFVLLCLEGKFQVQAPRGAYIRRGDLTEGFLRYDFGGADIWRGLYMEGLIFGILRYVYVGSTISRGGDGSEEIRGRLTMAKNKLSKLKFLWNGQDPEAKQRILREFVLLIATYGCET